MMFTNLLYLVLLVASSLSTSVIQNTGDTCSDNQWKCDDGSCLSIDGKWIGNVKCQKCQNSSVPSPTLRRKTRQAQNGICVLPEYPVNGKYTTHIPNTKPGQAYNLVTIKVTCDPGFALVGSASAYCDKGWWSEKMPKCVLQCHLPPHPSVEYRCLVFGLVEGSRACARYEINGTVVRPQCRSPNFYSATVLTYMRCIDGSWDYIAKCSPECGTFSSSGTDLVIGGETAKRAEVPWHAAIYTKTTNPYKQICGGSLISNNIILSAAHCFWDNFESKKLPAAEYAVAVGKLYRPWANSQEDAQKSDVKALHLPPLFQGSAANNQEDIAVVVVATPFKYTTFIRPVCIDFDNLFQNRQLIVGNLGKVAGWGLIAENGMPSQVLKVINLPYVSIDTCLDGSPTSFRGYLTGDKICAGFKNERKALCKGDSGGGLAFPESERGTPRYYLRGIVSTAPNNNDELCNANAYTAFTQILRHEYFIKQFWENEDHYYSDLKDAMLAPQDNQLAQLSTPNTILNVQELPCKELVGDHRWSPTHSVYNDMNNDILNHVNIKMDSAGHLTYFETHVAIKADGFVKIQLTDNGTTLDSDIVFNIDVGWENNQYTQLHVYSNRTWRYEVQNVHTPNILKMTEFRAFYVKIDDGKLEFGKEGDSSPLMIHHDDHLREVRYFQFYYQGSNKRGRIRYDCPAPIEELPCKEVLLRSNARWSPFYSMENKTFNHVKLNRNSAGHLSYFETHIAINNVHIELMDKEYPWDSDIVYGIGLGNEINQYTELTIKLLDESATSVLEVHTPNLISATELRAFYLKINDEKLEFGKEGDSSPIISYNDARLRKVNYFNFFYTGNTEETMRFDCPAPVKGSS